MYEEDFERDYNREKVYIQAEKEEQEYMQWLEEQKRMILRPAIITVKFEPNNEEVPFVKEFYN